MPTPLQYQSDVDELVRLATLDLRALWRQVDDAVVARELLADVLPDLAAVYGSATGTLAADYYDDLREEAAVRGRFRAIVAEPSQRTDELARWAVGPLFTDDDDPYQRALARAEGGLQRLIADVGRDTVMRSSIEDPQAIGWQRVTSGGCGFCQMLASRGAVYSESTVRFGAHDNCRCFAVPAFEGAPLPVHGFVPGRSRATQADRDRTRQWMRDNGYL